MNNNNKEKINQNLKNENSKNIEENIEENIIQEKNNQDNIDICQNQLKEYQDRYNYLLAEFDNYKKRIEKEKFNWISSGEENVLIDLLPLLDDFERAMNEIEKSKNKDDIKNYIQGFELIYKYLKKMLNKYNIQEIETNIFNPELHEAIMSSNSNKHKSGEIINTLEKGYKRNGKVIRASKVNVAN